jgi:hypothetical protein
VWELIHRPHAPHIRALSIIEGCGVPSSVVYWQPWAGHKRYGEYWKDYTVGQKINSCVSQKKFFFKVQQDIRQLYAGLIFYLK